MTVPSNDPRLLRPTGTAAQSPYIIAMERAGIKGTRLRIALLGSPTDFPAPSFSPSFHRQRWHLH